MGQYLTIKMIVHKFEAIEWIGSYKNAPTLYVSMLRIKWFSV